TGLTIISQTDAWAVGSYKNLSSNQFQTLTLHWTGTQWNYVFSPDHIGTLGDYLYAVDADSPTDVWAVGEWDNGDSDQLLILHWNGTNWSVSQEPNQGEPY